LLNLYEVIDKKDAYELIKAMDIEWLKWANEQYEKEN